MLGNLLKPFLDGSYAPHGYCLLWQPELIWTHVIADSLITLSYIAIPVALLTFVWRRRDIMFNMMFWLFAVFILACGAGHAVSIWNLWHANYGLEAILKVITAAGSVGTAMVVWRLIPKALKLASPEQLQTANDALEASIRERDKALGEMREHLAQREKAEEELRQAREVEAQLRVAEDRRTLQVGADAAKRKMLNDLAAQFENQVARAMGTVTKAIGDIEDGTQRVASAVSSSNLVASSVTRAATEASSSTVMIAAATEEMNLSLAEVSKQVQETSNFASRAVDHVGKTDEIVNSLGRYAAEIEDVVSLVGNIARQVNLLALNATIEASRAGEAGRGFAVVASEVKSLAQQTTGAATRISERIGAIQNVSHSAMEAINEIGHVIAEMGQLTTSVAVAVDQQVSTTTEIARNITVAAAGTSRVNHDLERVREEISVSGEAAEGARNAALEVSRQAKALQQEIDGFLVSVRAA